MIDQPFRGSDAVHAGLLSKNHLLGPRFVRVFPDVYVPAGLPLDLDVRSRAAYLLVGCRGGLLAGWSAVRLLGAEGAPLDAPAEVLVDHDLRRHAGLAVRRGSATGDDVYEVEGCRVTSPLRTAWDLGRRRGVENAVVALDALTRAHGIDPVELLKRREEQPGARGCRQLDRVVELADGRAESPMESRLRVLLVRSGLPMPQVQYVLRDEDGVVVARFDLAYPDARLAIEYDGREHHFSVLSADDRVRDARAGRLGWQTLRFTRDDLVRTRPRTVAVVREVLAERRSILRRAGLRLHDPAEFDA
ncbi:hypothetical protein PSU4_24590 [Pseudonocardia sulfidoxydans NBRC 16205]|uniref:DUF559 domain-containing protein n=2 Tax=Pseudonocardia sulfidoxydans TaxID=54011 RepID=A0A511DFD7_9PSEU|nr:DUF559 domain-containing protein [Pseudonocardia sulfidoxydans]GEL23505.1 hypothetical protein PSU4_24590 [Pseudonocardia sulfidoxydans NBRC 16205]